MFQYNNSFQVVKITNDCTFISAVKPNDTEMICIWLMACTLTRSVSFGGRIPDSCGRGRCRVRGPLDPALGSGRNRTTGRIHRMKYGSCFPFTNRNHPLSFIPIRFQRKIWNEIFKIKREPKNIRQDMKLKRESGFLTIPTQARTNGQRDITSMSGCMCGRFVMR